MAWQDNIYKYALQNAVKFKGTANDRAIVGKILSENPDARSSADEVKKLAAESAEKVNAMSAEEQEKELKSIAPELLEDNKKDKPKEEKDIFAFLGIRQGDYVAAAFPPEPSKYPHIGHAKAILMNYLLAKKYNGKFYLRFEDTNPKLAKKEFYDIHKENYEWLGVKPDKIDYASNHMEEFYIFAEELVKKGKAYVCTCETEKMRENRGKGIECKCRSHDEKRNLQEWRDMPLLNEGKAVLRMKIDLNHQNTTMRDPVIMRIIEGEHPRTGKRYKIWPNYDFENSVMDGITRISHRLRTKEFELRNELQRFIQNELGFEETKIYEFSRFNLEGVESSGRIIREKIENGELVGWDDPSLTTLVALRRRGFLPEAITNFVISTGITKAEATLTWDDLIVQNKRILDSICSRYFFIENPFEIKVENAPVVESHLKLHPEQPEKGTRDMKSHGRFWITRQDYDALQNSELYRLMDCINFKKENDAFVFDSKEHDKYKGVGKRIMHWLPFADDLVKTEVMMPDKEIKKGIAEHGIKNLKVGDIIQFERFGFCRLDAIDENETDSDNKIYKFWYTHK